MGDLLELHYIEIAKFRQQSSHGLVDPLERWLYFLLKATFYDRVTDLPEVLQQEEGMIIAMEATHNALCDEEVRYAIEARRKWERDRITELNAAVEAGEARGRAEGEALARRQLLRGLLQSGLSRQELQERLGVSDAELQGLEDTPS